MSGLADARGSSDSLTEFLQSQATLPREAKSSGKRAYYPYELSDRDCRYLEIRPNFPSMSVCLPYTQLVEINGEWRLGRSIILVFARGPHPVVVKIDGSDLHELYEALKQWRALAVAKFDPVEHFAVVNPKAGPYIRDITLIRGPNASGIK